MITWHLPSANRNEAIKRFATAARNAPTGLKELGRWHAARADGGYLVVETDGPKNILSLGTSLPLLRTPNCCRKARFSGTGSRFSLRATTIKIPRHRSVASWVGGVQATGQIINRFQADRILANDRVILDEFCLNKEYHRKYAIRLLN